MNATVAAPARPGMCTFLITWFGQLISIVGSGLTNFGLGVWVFQRTGSATEFALISVAAVLPSILVSPIAGAVADRMDRRRLMILGDTVAGLSTLVIVLLLAAGHLQVWHIYITSAVSSAASAFQGPAYMASVALMVPKKHAGRVSGLLRMADALSLIVAPALAGVLITRVGLEGIIFVDFATFLFAVGTLLLLHFPATPRTAAVEAGMRALLRDVVAGWRYLRERPGFLGTMLYFTALNFLFAFANVLLTPMVLSFSDAEGLGAIVSAVGVGLLAGSLVMSAWGGRRRKIFGVYYYGVGQGAMLILVGLRPDVLLISLAFIILAFGGPIADACIGAIRLTKVAPELQGRVTATGRMLSWGAIPLSFVLAGPLADHVFEPLMQPGGVLAPSLGRLVGVGDGRGIALMYVLGGVLTLLATVAALAHPRIRRIDLELPDDRPDEPARTESPDPVVVAP